MREAEGYERLCGFNLGNPATSAHDPRIKDGAISSLIRLAAPGWVDRRLLGPRLDAFMIMKQIQLS